MRGSLCALALAVSAALSSMAAAEVLLPFRLIKLDGGTLKWGKPVLGAGATVSYAFVEEPVSFKDARNCRTMVPMTAVLAQAGVAERAFQAEVAKAFQAWSSVADIRFHEVSDPAQADILIGAQADPKGRAFTNVEFEEAISIDVKPLDKSLICLNPEQPWKLGFNGDLNVYDLRYSIAHEIGHAIGLDHPGATGQVMSYKYDEQFDTLQAGDISGAVALYGRSRLMLADPSEAISVGTAEKSAKPGRVAERRHQTRALP